MFSIDVVMCFVLNVQINLIINVQIVELNLKLLLCSLMENGKTLSVNNLTEWRHMIEKALEIITKFHIIDTKTVFMLDP